MHDLLRRTSLLIEEQSQTVGIVTPVVVVLVVLVLLLLLAGYCLYKKGEAHNTNIYVYQRWVWCWNVCDLN